MDTHFACLGTETTWNSYPNQQRNSASKFKKNQLRPWKKQRYCIPEKDSARFIAQMEAILDVYTAKHSEDEPLICMDEAAWELKGDVKQSIPIQPRC